MYPGELGYRRHKEPSRGPTAAAPNDRRVPAMTGLAGGAIAAGDAGLCIRNVSKSFGDFLAVDGVDLAVRPGEFLTLLGPSGSGKTTLLMMIAGFLDPSQGTMTLDGRHITALRPEQRDFGMVFQGYALFPHMSVRANIAYPLEVRRLPPERIRQRVDEMLDLVQLQAFADRYPRQLSGGQQQRVALARAMSFGPRLLLLDEPLGALDRKLRGDVQEELKRVHLKTGTTFLYVTHDQDEALSMSDRIAIMNKGRIDQLGTPIELYEQPSSVFAAGFLGKSNFIAAEIADVQGHLLVCDVGGCRLWQRDTAASVARRGPITLALRPEKIGLAPGPENAASANKMPARIRNVTYYGAVMEIRCDSGPLGDLLVQAPAWRNEQRYFVGQSIWLHWPDDAAVIVHSDVEPGHSKPG
jgi:putative spermidine/putrescine transport system ATP-binding protein